MAKSLWGDLSSIAIMRTPKTILEEQAALLSEATGGMLVGTVKELASGGPNFCYTLMVVVPALNNYTYQILQIVHPLEMYPLNLSAARPQVNQPVKDQEALESAIEKVLTSAELRAVLSALKSQIVGP